jgi:hypothetical protein
MTSLEFIRKKDHRFKDEPFGSEKDSWRLLGGPLQEGIRPALGRCSYLLQMYRQTWTFVQATTWTFVQAKDCTNA